MTARYSQGIALVTALFLMVAIFGVGVGAVFLAQMNLGISVNVRSNALAQANAESGLDATIVALERAFIDAGSFPSSAPTTVAGVNYSPGYAATVNASGTDAFIQVIGTGPANAEHVSEALIRMRPGEPRFPPAWEYGLASEATCITTGRSQFLNAGIHCNLGFDLGNDTYGLCLERDADGTCIRFETIPVEDAPVSASPGATLCSPRQLCEGGVPRTLTEPIEIVPDYVGKRDAALDEVSSGTEFSTAFGISCDVVVSTVDAGLTTLLVSGATVCVESSATVTIPSGFELDGVNLVTTGDVILSSDTVVNDSTIISMAGRVEAASNGNAKTTVSDSRIYSELGIRLNGQQSSISGITTLASAGDVTINGGAPATTSPTGELGIGLVVISEGNVTVNGSSDWFVAVLAAGTFTQNGTSTLYGNVAAKGTLRFNGGVDIDSGLPVLNDDGNEPGTPRAEVLSRR